MNTPTPNTNGKHGPPTTQNTAPLAACLGILAVFVVGCAFGSIGAILIAQPVIANMIAACLNR
jgi:hypothetical protein